MTHCEKHRHISGCLCAACEDAFCNVTSHQREAIASLRTSLSAARQDSEILTWLEDRGVVSIYFADGTQFNPASMSLRAAVTLALPPRAARSPVSEDANG